MQGQYLAYERNNFASEWGAHFSRRRTEASLMEPEKTVYLIGDHQNVAAEYPRRQMAKGTAA